jgi:hypothetical protein
MRKEIKRENERWQVTYFDGKRAFVTARSSLEAVREGKKLYHLGVQKVEERRKDLPNGY